MAHTDPSRLAFDDSDGHGQWVLDGRPLRNGERLELLLPNGRWVPVRVETEFAGEWPDGLFFEVPDTGGREAAFDCEPDDELRRPKGEG
jgi:hypothetical protein